MRIELWREAINLLGIETGRMFGANENSENGCVVRNGILSDRSTETTGCECLGDCAVCGDDQLLLFPQCGIAELEQGCLDILSARIEMATRSCIVNQIDVIHEYDLILLQRSDHR